MCDITLEMYEYQNIKYPEVLSSGALGPCFAICIYNSKKKCGFMLHQPNPENDKDTESFIKIVTGRYKKSIKDIRIIVCGGSAEFGANTDEDEKVITINALKESKQYLKRLLNNYFKKNQITISFAKDNTITELIYDTSMEEPIILNKSRFD